MESFKEQLDVKGMSRWICDSALYSQSHLLSAKDYLWVCRVPETIKECKAFVSRSNDDFQWEQLKNGYQGVEQVSDYGGVRQRWFLIYSQQATDREKKTFEKKIEKKEKSLTKELWHLKNENFNCEQDAQKAVEKLRKKHPYFNIDFEMEPLKNYSKPGRPKSNEKKIVTGYRIQAEWTRNPGLIEQTIHSKGRFILATNDFLYGRFLSFAFVRNSMYLAKYQGLGKL